LRGTRYLDRIVILVACHADWNGMTGDQRVRHCAECDKNVFHLSELTRPQAEALLRQYEGNLCARFYRRPDGTVLTKTCEQGLRAASRRLASRVSVLMSTALVFTPAAAMAQNQANSPQLVQIREVPTGTGSVSGTVKDRAGAVVPKAKVTLTLVGSEEKRVAEADEEGRYRISALAKGLYRLSVTSPGFAPFQQPVAVSNHREMVSDVRLEVGLVMVGEVVVPRRSLGTRLKHFFESIQH
jgi:hypothetical protein